MMVNPQTVFIGSSSERLEDAYAIAHLLTQLGCEVRVWPDEFPGGEYTLESLLRVSKEVTSALFLLMDDDKIWYRGNEVRQPRDNVVLEYGLFLATLGRKNCVVVTQDGTKIATDLRGLNLVLRKESDAWIGIRQGLKSWLQGIVPPPKVEHYASGDWSATGTERWVGSGEAPMDFVAKVNLKQGADHWYGTMQVNLRPSSSYIGVKTNIALKLTGFINEMGWMCLSYGQDPSGPPRSGMFHLKYCAHPESLSGFYSGFSPARGCVVVGTLELRRPTSHMPAI